MAITPDLSSLIWDYLKTNVNAASVRALVYGGATNIVEVGDVSARLLAEAHSARRTAGETSKVLFLSVQDAGVRPTARLNIYNHYVIVRAFDRDRGYRNLRSVRLELLDQLRGHLGRLTGVHGLLDVIFSGSTGFRHDIVIDADYEALTFVGVVMEQELD